jgi:tRNA threonylcarbamoyladenosine biosynthesis protein TsaB
MTEGPLILALETSSRIGSVAIATAGEILAQTVFSGPLRHSVEIFPAINGLLDRFSRKPHQIQQIYISAGPGSFTGLRIAATLAKTMHLAFRSKIVTVDTLDVIAANAVNLVSLDETDIAIPELEPGIGNKVAAVLDAKRGQFFIAVYGRQQSEKGTIWAKIVPDTLMTAHEFLERFAGCEEPVWLLGDGLVYYRDKFKADSIRFLGEKYWSPRAAKVHFLGWQKAKHKQFADPLTLIPNYLRKPDVTLKKL